jgi:hypothetical protein
MFLEPFNESDPDNKNKVLAVCMVCMKRYTIPIEDYNPSLSAAYCPACQYENAVLFYPILFDD